MVVDAFGSLQMVLGGFSSYDETGCFKFKRSRQMMDVFVVCSNFP